MHLAADLANPSHGAFGGFGRERGGDTGGGRGGGLEGQMGCRCGPAEGGRGEGQGRVGGHGGRNGHGDGGWGQERAAHEQGPWTRGREAGEAAARPAGRVLAERSGARCGAGAGAGAERDAGVGAKKRRQRAVGVAGRTEEGGLATPTPGAGAACAGARWWGRVVLVVEARGWRIDRGPGARTRSRRAEGTQRAGGRRAGGRQDAPGCGRACVPGWHAARRRSGSRRRRRGARHTHRRAGRSAAAVEPNSAGWTCRVRGAPPPAGRWARTQRRRAAASGSPADQAPRCFGYTRTGAEAELGAALQRMCVTGRSHGTTFLLKRCERLRLPETASIMVT